MSEIWTNIGVVANVVAAGGIFFAVKQLSAQRQAWADEHERRRREKAIELISHFNDKFAKEWSATRRLVDVLTDEQLRKMDEGEPFEVDQAHRKYVVGALPGVFQQTNSAPFTLDSEHSFQLRFQALEILNATEILCEAWGSDVANSEIVERQLRFLHNPDPHFRTTLMPRYLDLMDGQKRFPALTKYLDGLRPQ